MRDTGTSESDRSGDVVLGDDWVAPQSTVSKELRVKRARRSLFSLRGSPLTRKIITFNLIALIILVAGILYLNDARDGLVVQRAGALVGETQLVADVFEAQITGSAPVNLATGDGIDVIATLDGLSLRRGAEVFVFDAALNIVGQTKGMDVNPGLQALFEDKAGSTIITDALTGEWRGVWSVFVSGAGTGGPSLEPQIGLLVPDALAGGCSTGN